jgi:predicted ArsR family transcriptional regulator
LGISESVKNTFKIRKLEQVRLLTDPFKLQLLQSFAEAAKTTKQVAAELDESVTRLYRHVDALHDGGLLEVVREKQKRGTIERTFRAVAQRFDVDHALFSGDVESESMDLVREAFRACEEEVLAAMANATGNDNEQAIFFRIKGKASREKIAVLRALLNEWLESVPGDDEAPADEAEEIGGLIAFYEID